MKKEIFLGLFTILIGLLSFNNIVKAQSINIDSLIEAVSKLPFQQKAIQLSQINYTVLVTNTKKLIPVFEKYLNSVEIKHWPLYQAQLYEQLSLAYYIGGKYDKNFEAGLKALNLYDSLNLQNKVGMMYGELGYRTKRINLKKAFELMQHGIHILLITNNKEQLAKIYDNYGVLHEMNQQFDSAIYFYKKALYLKKALNDRFGLPFTLNNISIVYLMTNQPDSAVVYLDSATHMRICLNDKSGLAECYSLYGDYYQLTNQLDKAVDYFKLALELADTLNFPYMQSELYQKLSVCYEQKSNPFKALFHLKKYMQLRDSLVNAETNKAIADLQIKYETEKKEQQIKIQKLELSKKETQINAAYFLIFIIIVSGFLGYRYYRGKQKHQLRETVLHTEVSERTRIAKDMHDELGASLTKIMIVSEVAKTNSSNSGLIKENIETINNTVKDLSSNLRDFVWTLNPENATLDNLFVKLREFCADLLEEAGIEFSINFADNIPELEISKKAQRNIYLASKEVVNNIAKHAACNHVNITAEVSSSVLNVKISDNGKGFDKTSLKSSGNGLINIKQRIEGLGGTISIESKPGEGTKIQFEIELNKLI